jgi:phage gpG-like protein
MPIKVEIIGAKQLEKASQRFLRGPDDVGGRIFDATLIFGARSEGFSKKDYLKGPRPHKLGVGTGRLRSSIKDRVLRNGNDIEMVLGTNVRYAAIHELGFSGTQQVRPHQRRITRAGLTKSGKVSRSNKNRVSTGIAQVKAFSRTMWMPPRPFLSPAVRDAMPEYENSIRRILNKVISEGASDAL